MPRKSAAQKWKAKEPSGQEGQDRAEGHLGKLRRLEDMEAVRNADGVEEKMRVIGTLLRTTVEFMKPKSDEVLGFLFDNVITYFDVVVNLK